MKLHIGVDFDNTIACYDEVFHQAASVAGMNLSEGIKLKSDIKRELQSRPDGECEWQKLQGLVYGKFMSQARIFPGFMEFLALCQIRGHKVSIVSHKTEFGHFDEDKIPLRGVANDWLKARAIQYEVFFEGTRDGKIQRIIQQGCTHFIDDLEEVLNDLSFPANVSKLLFKTSGSYSHSLHTEASWRGVLATVLGEWKEEEVLQVCQIKFNQLQLTQIKLVKGRGNSRVFRLENTEGKSFALKIYPDSQHDRRPRLQTEFSTCELLKSAGLPVCEAIVKDEDLNWAIYGWLEGVPVSSPDVSLIEQAVNFIKNLKEVRGGEGIPYASEAFVSGAEFEQQLRLRLQQLQASDSNELKTFLQESFIPVMDFFIGRAKKRKDFSVPTIDQHRVLSPSDFGFHNTLLAMDGRLGFIDFEYFGWDDPIKLVSDFYWHPGMNLTPELREFWLEKSLEILPSDRLADYLPLFGLKWCLILLNEFLPHRLAQRLHADSSKASDVEGTLQTQLKKSKELLKLINLRRDQYGSTLQVS